MSERLKSPERRLPPFVDAVFFLDVDQTLAGDQLVRLHIQRYKKLLTQPALTLEPDEEVQLDLYRNVFDIPSVARYSANNPVYFERVRNKIRSDYTLHARELDRIPASLQGVWRLAVAGYIGGYYTVRPKKMNSATQRWLGQCTTTKSNGERLFSYPNHDLVTICLSPEDKIRQILSVPLSENQNNFTRVLIDDGVSKLIAAAVNIQNQEPSLRDALSKLVLVGFRFDTKGIAAMEESSESLFRVLPLPSWSHEDVDTLLTQIAD